jgi:aspartyl/asparaginyl-tRNA synthetase/glutamyl-tRNA reductase
MKDSSKVEVLCLELAERKIDEEFLKILDAARLPPLKTAIGLFREKLGGKLLEIAIVEKCNAVMMVAVHDLRVAPDHLRYQLLALWDAMSKGGILTIADQIKQYVNDDALQHLAETAVGIHSVTIGDTQVFSQVRDGFQGSIELQKDAVVLVEMKRWIEDVANDILGHTELNKGQTSIERLTCSSIIEYLKGASGTVGIIGLGSSGKLVAKILLEEYHLPLVLSNRTPQVTEEFCRRYGGAFATLGDFSAFQKCSAIVLAMPATEQTSIIARDLLQSFNSTTERRPLLIDLGSPPLLDYDKKDTEVGTVLTLSHLSGYGERVLRQRAGEANKARQRIVGKLASVSKAIESRLADARFKEQRSSLSLDCVGKKLGIYRIRHSILHALRTFLEQRDFTEVTTPYVVGMSTDPPRGDRGAAFSVSWPGQSAFLRQSNQIYKQMIVAAGPPRIFEIGPFWRHEDRPSYCHLDETIGLDVELADPDGLRCLEELAYALILEAAQVVKKSANGPKTELFLPAFDKLPIYSYEEAIDLLMAASFPIRLGEELGVLGDASLGSLVKRRTGNDALIVERYPASIKKFYTKQTGVNQTLSFNLILSQWEITGGAIRETNRENIERAMRLSGIDPRRYDFYLSFFDQAPPHGGFGMGFDRLVARLLGLDDIRESTPFPRTFDVLVP